jgi:hypothetical protein
MAGDKKSKTVTPADNMFGHLIIGREGPPLAYKTLRPKRRRKGKLNDGEQAPGHGPDANRKRSHK